MRSVTYINYAQPIIVTPAPVTSATIVNSPTTFAADAPPESAYSPTAVTEATADEINDAEAYPADPNDATAAAESNQDKALDMFDTARALFKRGDFALALSQTDRAVALMPNDPLMHEFRALCLFAMKDYGQAAAATYAVLSVGPGWDWATLEGLYNNMAVYQAQLKALEAYRDANPDTGNAHFLLAYHYLLDGRTDQAAAELQAVVKLEPKDALAAQLLQGLTTPEEEGPGPELNAPTLAVVPVEAASLPGKWIAERRDGSTIELSLTADHKFAWTVMDEEKPQKLSGTYSFADNYLILSAAGQSTLVGQISKESADAFRFKLASGSPNDPGLVFKK